MKNAKTSKVKVAKPHIQNAAAKTKKQKNSAKESVRSIELKNIKLSKRSKNSLKKIKDSIWGNVANAIECGNWHVPSDTYEFIDVKTDFEKSMYGFFDLPKDAIVEIDCYDSGIMSFEKGVYPKYHS